MTRRVFRFVDWRISPDDSPPARPTTFQIECVACSVVAPPDDALGRSPVSEDFADVQTWALEHSGRHPTHTQYREHIERYWRTEMLGGSAAL